MALNTYPYSPFPASTEQLHKGDNEDLQAQIDAIKDGTNIDSFGDVETALEDKTDTAVIAPDFDAESGVYAVGDLVMYQGKLYEFTTAHETAGDWDSTEVTEKTVADELDTLKSGLNNLIKTITVPLSSESVAAGEIVDANIPFATLPSNAIIVGVFAQQVGQTNTVCIIGITRTGTAWKLYYMNTHDQTSVAFSYNILISYM